ncbi:MAG: phosphatidylserine decarboxylase [Thermoplasmata archaeon]
MLAKGCLRIVAVPAVLALVSLLIAIWSPTPAIILFAVFTGISVVFAIFFRDPERKIGQGIVSPADGLLTRAEASEAGAYFSIFMNIHDVHVNRAPWPGRVVEVRRVPGGHAPAYRKKADRNERVVITLESSLGRILITQIAGVFARRIVTYVRAGQELSKGDRIGIIRFGSRVDLFVPAGGLKLRVRRGERVKAGSTTLAEAPGRGEGRGSR